MRAPAPLVAIMAASFVLAFAWASLTPTFQAPDEQTHFAYVQFLAERFELPGDREAPIYSSEHIEAAFAVKSDQLAALVGVRPEWADDAYEQWVARTGDARDDGGGPTSASSYPPAAYAWQALGYRAAARGDFFDRLFAARLFSALWLPVTVLGTWLLAGELLGRRRILQLAAAGVPALAPMVAFVSGSVNPDGMLYALWTLALWLGVRCLRHGLSVRDGAAFVAVVGLACITKTAAYALLPAAALVVALGLWRRRGLPVRRLAGLAGAVALPLVLTLGAWIVLARSADRPAAAQVAQATAASSGTDWRALLSYVWQYYLPRVPGQNDLTAGPGYPAFQVWIKQGWAAFGWLEIRFPDNVYRALGILTAAIGAAAAVTVWRARRRIDLAVAAFLALVVVSLLGGLHWTDYHLPSGFMQARYVFPLAGLFGCALAAAVALLPERRRPVAVGAALGGLFVFHVVSFGLVAERFYA